MNKIKQSLFDFPNIFCLRTLKLHLLNELSMNIFFVSSISLNKTDTTMGTINFIIDVFRTALFSSADPCLFGSKKRIEKKHDLAQEFKEMAGDTQSEIDILKGQNPFESAAAKSAMAEAARRSKQIGERYANMMGANATPEAMIAAQGQTQNAIAGTAGDIATGAEANKLAQLSQLRGEKMGQMGQYGQTEQSSIDEYGSGWKDFFSSLNVIGNTIGNVAKAF